MINASTGPVSVLIPLGGWSMIDAPGGPFWWPEADQAFVEALKAALRAEIPVVEMDCNLNDPSFAASCARTLLRLMNCTWEPAGA